MKAYGFTKYHQKLMNNTNYQFLKESKIINRVLLENKAGSPIRKSNQKQVINITIWGHSLNISDESYIQEIFSFNEKSDENIRIKIFYFNDQAKFDLLANLLEILEKGKVEYWMKKGWLKFEKNPDIAEINGIEPAKLPKFEEA